MNAILNIQKQNLINPILKITNKLGFLDMYSNIRSYCKSQYIIFLYHRVGPNKSIWLPNSIDIYEFENQLRYLSKTYTFLSLDTLVRYIKKNRQLPNKVAVITFDDGYKDNYTYAFPILKKYNVPATIFLTTGYLNNGKLFY